MTNTAAAQSPDQSQFATLRRHDPDARPSAYEAVVAHVGLTADDTAPPPFTELGVLANTRAALDDNLSQLIGRLAPYTAVGTVATEIEIRSGIQGDSRLEIAIRTEASLLGELNDRVGELLRDLRL